MVLEEKRLNGETLFEGKILTLQHDDVELPNGNCAKREIVRHPGAVAVVPVLPNGDIVMVRQFRYPICKAILEIPAGKLDCGEQPEQCALRELEEETGYTGSVRKLIAIHTTPGFSDELIHLYIAENLHFKKQCLDEDEFVNVEILSRSKLRELIKSGELSDAKSLVALMLIGIME
ncbi:MAG: NUDIX hydrolase [Negativicutes bacterium]|jgi:ADP-ribose pyrophosphatase